MVKHSTVLIRLRAIVKAMLEAAHANERVVKAAMKTHDPFMVAEMIFGKPELTINECVPHERLRWPPDEANLRTCSDASVRSIFMKSCTTGAPSTSPHREENLRSRRSRQLLPPHRFDRRCGVFVVYASAGP